MSWVKKHKVLTIVGVVIILGIIGVAAGGGDTTNQSSNTNSNSGNNSSNNNSNTQSSMAKIGQPARDGKFEFVVKSITCGKTSVGTSQYLTKTPQGQFCLLSLNVKNIGDGPQSLFSDNQYLYNASGQKYSADSIATSYAAPQDNSTWYSEINPGNSVEGVIVFDLPKDQSPVTAELHDSALSGGVKVSLN